MTSDKTKNARNPAPSTQSHSDLHALEKHLENIKQVESSRAVAKEAASKAVKEIIAFMKDHSIFDNFFSSTRPEHVLRLRMSAISNSYYRYKFNHLSAINEIDKKELISVAKLYEKTIKRIDSVSMVTRLYVFSDLLETDKEATDSFATTRATLQRDLENIRRLAAKKRGRGSLPIPHVKEVVELAATLFTRCSGRRFKINWEAVGDDFVTLDSLFVQKLLQAIDPEITFANVRTALHAVSVQDEVRAHQSVNSE